MLLPFALHSATAHRDGPVYTPANCPGHLLTSSPQLCTRNGSFGKARRHLASGRSNSSMAASASLKDFWSKGAEAYAQFSGEGGLKPLHEKILGIVEERHLQPGSTVLDVACGDGEPACSIAKSLPECKVTATDFAQGMVKLAEKRAASLGLKNIHFALADAMDLSDFPDASVDLLTCVAALFMVPDFNKALREFKRVLKPGGAAVFTTWGKPEEMNMATTLFTARKRLQPDFKPLPRSVEIDPNRLATEEMLTDVVTAAGFPKPEIGTLNLNFRVNKREFEYPNGAMLSHPMFTAMVGSLEATGVPNALKALTKELDVLYEEGGYRKADGSCEFPKNKALIAVCAV